MKKDKGQYGYRNHRKRMRMLLTGIFIAAILLQLLVRHFTDNPSTRNILTVMAILTVLPMANIASPLLASWKYKTPDRDFYDKVLPYEERFPILYDLVLTTKECIMPMDVIVVHPKAVIAYCTNPKVDTPVAEKFLNEMLRGHKLDANAKVIKDEQTFFRRLDTLKPASEYEADGSEPYVIALMKSLSM
ncbi:MAG: O-linked GlcNAc transferase-like protein [Lachnospiraceae bacterium]